MYDKSQKGLKVKDREEILTRLLVRINPKRDWKFFKDEFGECAVYYDKSQKGLKDYISSI